MKPGIYEDEESVKLAEASYWDAHGYRFGAWQFLPETGEVRRNGCMLHQLGPGLAADLARLVEAYPAYVAGEGSIKTSAFRLRKVLGRDSIVSVHAWGFRFNPEAVL